MVKKMTIEILAGMIKRGFDATTTKDDFHKVEERLTGVEERLTGVEERLTGVEERLSTGEQRMTGLEQKVDQGFQHINARLDLLRNDISDLPAMRQELRNLGQRVDRLERSAKR